MHRISTKLVVAVLAAVILPFVAFAVFLDVQIGERVTRRVAQQALLGLAKDLGGQIDLFVEERRRDVELWAGAPYTDAAVEDYVLERARLRRVQRGDEAPDEGRPAWNAELLARATLGEVTVRSHDLDHWTRWLLTTELNRNVALKRVYDLILVVAADGRLVTTTSRTPDGLALEPSILAELFARDYSQEAWFQGALEGGIFTVDQHDSAYRWRTQEDGASNLHLGFAAPVQAASPNGPTAVLYALVNWRTIQQAVSGPVVKDAFRGLVEGREPTPYAWIWGADADTILAHPDRALYGKSIIEDVGLPQLTHAVRGSADDFGLYPQYTFRGVDKSAAFTRTLSPAQGGFGWVVGVGIDDADIYATAGALRALLLGGTAVVLLMATLWTFVIARRTTGPIHELQRYTRRVAEGDLDARIRIRSRDELGELADDFNAMTRELKAQRAMLVKAEKDAAWREMARQIAHDIKNPLTPINLSLDLLERARRENAPGSEEILERTIGLIRRQVDHLREIAGDFYEFTGGRKPNPERFELTDLIDEVLHLHDAWAVESGVAVQREGTRAEVYADQSKLRRVFVNLVSNALQAMPDGGRLFVATSVEQGLGGRCAVVRIRDTGHGLAPEARGHLFEPYFTTKSEGTGLGLAISRRVVEECGGEIALESARASTEEPGHEPGNDAGAGSGQAGEGVGTVATVRLPLAEPGP